MVGYICGGAFLLILLIVLLRRRGEMRRLKNLSESMEDYLTGHGVRLPFSL